MGGVDLLVVVRLLVRGVSEGIGEGLVGIGGWDSRVSMVLRGVFWVEVQVSGDVVVGEVWVAN